MLMLINVHKHVSFMSQTFVCIKNLFHDGSLSYSEHADINKTFICLNIS